MVYALRDMVLWGDRGLRGRPHNWRSARLPRLYPPSRRRPPELELPLDPEPEPPNPELPNPELPNPELEPPNPELPNPELEPPVRPPELPLDDPPVEAPELLPDDPAEPAGQVPPEHVAPITVQSVQAAPFVPHAVSAVPVAQLPLTSQQPVQDGPHATPVPLLPPLLELLPLSSPLMPLLPVPDDDPPDATAASSPGLGLLEAPPSPPRPKPVPT